MGISDSKELSGIEQELKANNYNYDQYQRIMLDRIGTNTFDGSVLTHGIGLNLIEIEGKQICRIDVPRADEPVYLLVKKENNQLAKTYLARKGPTNDNFGGDLWKINDNIRRHFYLVDVDDCNK